MELSLSFLFIIIFIILPGLIYRRLFYYGDFSKQFNAGHNLVSLLAISSLPGLIISIISFAFYSYFFKQIDLGEIIDLLKDINNPEFKLNGNKIEFNKLIIQEAAPYILFLYVMSSLAGILIGRIIRITKLDTRFRLLQFKNIWFYLFTGQYSGFKKLRHLKQKNKKHLFTKADILIDTNSKTYLYSGIVIDYEISDNDCCQLTKVILQKAERYSLRDGIKTKVEIPGTLLIVDCSTMKNINLNYIYEDTKSLLKSEIPSTLELTLGIIIVLIIPFFIFRSDSINIGIYIYYFNLPWYSKIFAYLFSIQLISMINPFERIKDEYRYLSFKTFFIKFLLLILFYVLI